MLSHSDKNSEPFPQTRTHTEKQPQNPQTQLKHQTQQFK